MIFKLLIRILLYCLRLAPDSHSHSAQGVKEKAETLPPGEKGEEAVTGPGFCHAAPCLNGCIGISPTEEETGEHVVTEGFDSGRASFYFRGEGREDGEMEHHSRDLPMS